MNIEVKVIEIINEDAYASASNVGGMGPVTPAQPSTNAGCTIGSGFASGGGTTGSGDVGNAGGFYQKGGKKKKKKKLSEVLQQTQDWTKGAGRVPRLETWATFNTKHLNNEN